MLNSMNNSNKMGAHFLRGKWIFRVFSTHEKLVLRVYPEAEGSFFEEYAMEKIGDCFELELEADLSGYGYVYVHEGELILDPYSRYVTREVGRGVLLEDHFSDPLGFREHRRPNLHYKEAVVYEHHLRDFSMDPQAKFRYPGKFRALTESLSLKGYPIGTDYMASLGVTHIHLLPITPIMSLRGEDGYNWGYDPEYFFAPHRGYLCEPEDPKKGVAEIKEAIMHLHGMGLGVVLDVVYNHSYYTLESCFEKLAPGYYFRMDEHGFCNGSGVGNELASEKAYVRELILDSLVYWLEEYKVDGFRFDLWGLMDQKTVLDILKLLREKYPEVLLYGEPWGNGWTPSTFLSYVFQAGKDFSLFNDRYRDGLRGKNDDSSKGYIQNSILGRNDVLTGIVGDIGFSQGIRGKVREPWETMAYMSCHDNLILLDKLILSTNEDLELLRKRAALGFSIQLLSFGNTFIHSGTEFMRSKTMDKNSYASGDKINMVRWKQRVEEQELVSLVMGLLALRRRFKIFTSFNAEEIRKKLFFYLDAPVIYFKLDLGEEELFIGHNPTNQEQELPFKEGKYYLSRWQVHLEGQEITKETIAPLESVLMTRRKDESFSY